jgi:serine/threonine protein kinase
LARSECGLTFVFFFFFVSFFSFFVLRSLIFVLAEFRDLLQQIFQRDPRQRISIHGVMAHPWTGF